MGGIDCLTSVSYNREHANSATVKYRIINHSDRLYYLSYILIATCVYIIQLTPLIRVIWEFEASETDSFIIISKQTLLQAKWVKKKKIK